MADGSPSSERALKQTAGEILVAHRAHEAQGRLVAWHEPELLGLHHRLMDLLQQGARMGDEKTSRFCGGLLDLWPALWNITEIPGVEPTNYADVRVMPMLVGGVVARR